MLEHTYSNDLKVEEALRVYFAKYHFADGGYQDKYFKIKTGPLFIPVPNTKARIRAVKIHDIHHLLTEYTALWKGEIEIGAWEIASGCGKHYVAWLLNFGSFSIGLFIYPRALFKAYMAGKRVKTNLYQDSVYDNTLLNKTLGELRAEMGVGRCGKTHPAHYAGFSGWVLLTLAVLLISVFIACSVLNFFF